MGFEPFPHIEGFSQAVKQVRIRYKDLILPTLKLIGTVKMHGTNGSVIQRLKTNEFQYQSRNHVLTEGLDNFDFKKFITERNPQELFDIIRQTIQDNQNNQNIQNIQNIQNNQNNHEVIDLNNYDIGIYGEFCGKAIQKKVAITGLEYFFVIFGIRLIPIDSNNSIWYDMEKMTHMKNHSKRIYNVYDFPVYTLDIDFNYPDKYEKEIMKLTDIVANECPVGKFFGISGPGEGIVWHLDKNNKNNKNDNFSLVFKSKSESFLPSTLNKMPKPDNIKNDNTIVDIFIMNTLTEYRLNQGIDYTKEMLYPEQLTTKTMGIFLKWIVEDILREESDTIEEYNLKEDELKKLIPQKAKRWFIQYLLMSNEQIQENNI
ncbi:MAG: RNA ligase [Terrestrivirus sp.]|uniref:RNA ligase n=1 Tax=Terrestrivirus sp. TaxID=2487775 RepID=A0A3G4ZP28_9VIRU|nr:MAG: RNA ligase [Terrestrivirus sp.]